MNYEPVVDERLAAEHGLSAEEYERVISILGRVPTYTELGIFSVMWSEHCSYKNSLQEIRTLPRAGKCLLAEAGEENAGLIEISDDLAIAFKIESHNHPSAVEPYQGAATGVGGILRDVMTMGARPIAILDSLRFGELEKERTKYLLAHIVKGIADYGNSFGVPTVGGEVYFDRSYNNNPLVNAMAVAVVPKAKVIRAVAKGVGNPVLIVGSSTGRDGIHGATFASEEISSRSEDRRPSVQVGDPFTEKCLLEALLEANDANCLVAVQDMGAAGIACSTSEMSARGGVGMEINLDLVPVREENMSAYEIVLSESQERMLIVAVPEKVQLLKEIFSKWDIQATEVGRVTDDDQVRFWKDRRVCAQIPARSLVAGYDAPVYTRDARKPSYLQETDSDRLEDIPEPRDLRETLLRMISSPNLASKKWIYEQYDTGVQTNSLLPPGHDAALIRIKGTDTFIALSTDCNARYVYLNPRVGAMIAVAEAARNVISVGARPVAITNCLNFGNPYDPEIYWQFKEAIAGIREACLALSTPVTGGNVSFYNEGPDGAVMPTAVIGMVGLMSSQTKPVSCGFKNAGDLVAIVGETRGHVGGSEYLLMLLGKATGQAPPLDLELEKRTQQAILDLIDRGLLSSCHDLSEGGLALALTESCIYSPKQRLGAVIGLSTVVRPDFYLFGEDQSRFLISFGHSLLGQVESVLAAHKLQLEVLGYTSRGYLTIDPLLSIPVAELADVYTAPIPRSMTLSI